MTFPGVGPVTALAFKATIDAPARFGRSNDVGAHLGLTPRQYQSGETDVRGRISRSGYAFTRTALFTAAHVMLTRGHVPAFDARGRARSFRRSASREAGGDAGRPSSIFEVASGCETLNQMEMTMTNERMALLELIEKQADTDLIRGMLAFAAGRIMKLEVKLRTGLT